MAARDLEGFRRAFRTGERVLGRVVSRPDALRAFVDISGFELLALTDTNPPPGAVLTFLITRMHPTVVLREVARGAESPEIDPRRAAAALSAFARARTALEARLADLGRFPGPSGPGPVDLAALKRTFLAHLRRDPAVVQALAQATAQAREISTLSRSGRFLYAPWYPPGATGHELLLAPAGPGGSREINLSFRLAQAGEVRLKILWQGDTARYLVFAAHPRGLPPADLLPVAARLGRRLVRLTPLAGPRPLAEDAPSLAASLLGNRAGSFTGVNLRV